MLNNAVPTGFDGTARKITDMGADIQYELAIGSSAFSAYLTYIHEQQDLDTIYPGAYQNKTVSLNTMKVNASYYFANQFNLSAGYFSTTGTSDNILYSGANNGVPDSGGMIAEFDYLPWLNTKFSLQYIMYNKFDGFTGSGASNNNTIYLLTWVMF